MNELDKVISIAKTEEGYLEKASNRDLDSKIGNAGSKNYTKYARDLDNISGFYNGKKQGYAWCDVFVDWCFVKAFGVKRAKELLCQPNYSLGAGVYYSANYYRNKKQFYTSNPKAGDQIFFKNSKGNPTHTGLVYDVDKKYVYTVEGNTSSASGVVSNGGCVRLKKYSLNYKYIIGYGRPNYFYEERIKYNYTGIFPKIPKNGSIKRGMKGTQVGYLQMFLNWANECFLEIDNSCGPLTEKQIKIFQEKVGLTVDGHFGPMTLKQAKLYKR